MRLAVCRSSQSIIICLPRWPPDCRIVPARRWGVDRVVMLALGAESIGDVIAFTVDRA